MTPTRHSAIITCRPGKRAWKGSQMSGNGRRTYQFEDDYFDEFEPVEDYDTAAVDRAAAEKRQERENQRRERA